ncbi:MAG: hypothetical protein ACRC42_04345 [Mycoplasma sp.]
MLKDKIIAKFAELCNCKTNDILSVSHFYSGYKNDTYLVIKNDGSKYQLKILKSGLSNFNQEVIIYRLYNFDDLLYSDGNIFIKKWYEKINNLDEDIKISLIKNEIKKFHNLDLNNLLDIFPFNKYDEYIKNHTNYYQSYVELLQKYKTEFITSHNDINDKNILFVLNDSKAEIKFIDFEWSSLNYKWFDIINYLAECEVYDEITLSKWLDVEDSIESLNDIYNLLFVRWVFSLAWAESEKNTLPNMEEYIYKCKINLEKILKLMH